MRVIVFALAAALLASPVNAQTLPLPNSDEAGVAGEHGQKADPAAAAFTITAYETALREILAQTEAQLEAIEAHARNAAGPQLEALRDVMAELRSRRAVVQTDLIHIDTAYDYALQDTETIERALQRYHGLPFMDETALRNAWRALGEARFEDARIQFEHVRDKAAQARAHMERAEAEAEYHLGLIAEREIRLREAAMHHGRAASLAPNFERLKKASQLHQFLGDNLAALSYAQLLLDAASRDYGAQSAQAVAAMDKLALLYNRLGKFEEAESFYSQALTASRRTTQADRARYGERLSALATFYYGQGRHQEAEPLFIQALENARHTIGEAHYDFAIQLYKLGLNYQMQGRHEEAEPRYRQALKIGRENEVDNTLSYAQILGDLAAVRAAQDDDEEAEALLNQALQINRDAIGEKNTLYATHLGDLGDLYLKMARYKDAEPLLEQAAALMRELVGEAHSSYGVRLLSLGELHHQLGAHARARALLYQARGVIAAAFGETDAQTQRVDAQIADYGY